MTDKAASDATVAPGASYEAGATAPASERDRVGPPPIAVLGPTATGKTALALDVAQRLGGEIVNVDAMQLYRGMDIGTAKTPHDRRAGVPHHQIDVLGVRDTASVAAYQQAARADVDRIRGRGRVPIIVGGSMMYVQALIDDWSFPETEPAERARWQQRLARLGAPALHRELRSVDPAAAEHILPSDGRRIVRALEVVSLTGRPYAASRPVIGEPRWGALMVGIDRSTDELDRRIGARTRGMYEQGLVDETRMLVEQGLRDGVTARRAIGYSQVLAYFDGLCSLEEAEESTRRGTRRYVRRQRSWFRRDRRIMWFDGADPHLTDRVLGRAGAA